MHFNHAYIASDAVSNWLGVGDYPYHADGLGYCGWTIGYSLSEKFDQGFYLLLDLYPGDNPKRLHYGFSSMVIRRDQRHTCGDTINGVAMPYNFPCANKHH